MCVFCIYTSRNSCCPLQTTEAQESTYTRDIQKTIVREGTVEVPASPKQDTEADTVKP